MRRTTTFAAIAAALATMATQASAQTSGQRYYMRAKLVGMPTAATPPVEYKGTWFNTGEQATGLCNNNSRTVDWVYACRINGNVSGDGRECDPAKKPNTAWAENCSSLCGEMDQPGYISSGGGGRTVSGTVDEMKAIAKNFCEGYNARPDLDKACSLVLTPGQPGQGFIWFAANFAPLPVTQAPNSWHGSCQTAR